MAKSVKQQILSRIYGGGRGWTFTPNDFVVDFKKWEISNSLEDLTNENKIRRIMRGLYDYPLYSELLNKIVAPDMEQVANALARKFAWRVQPTGETALAILFKTLFCFFCKSVRNFIEIIFFWNRISFGNISTIFINIY